MFVYSLHSWKWCESGHTQHLRFVTVWFVASCHKRALVYMNAVSVLRHKRSQIEENICIFCKMPAKTNHYYFLCVAWWGLLAHMFPESFSFTLNSSISLITVILESHARFVSEPTAAFPELERPHVHYHPSVAVCLTHLSLEVICPLEIYLSWSEDAPWLSAVGCVRLVHAGGFLLPGRSHPYSSIHLEHFPDSSPQRHTQEPPVAASWWAALKTLQCQI